MLKLVTRIFFAFCVGLVLCLWIIQNTTSVKELVSTKILAFLQEEWKSTIDIRSAKINFFTCSVYFKNGMIKPKIGKEYAWHFDQCKVHVSPLGLLFRKECALSLTFNNIKAYTAYKDGNAAITDHITSMFIPHTKDFSFNVNDLTINNMDLVVDDYHNPVHLFAPGSLTVVKNRDDKNRPPWNGNISVVNGIVWRNNICLAHHVNGSTSFYKDRDLGQWLFSAAMQTASSMLDSATIYTVQGAWSPAIKSVTIKDPACAVNITGQLVSDGLVGIKGHAPLYLLNNVKQYLQQNGVQTTEKPTKFLANGTCAVDLVLSTNLNKLLPKGSVLLSNLSIANVPIQSISLSLSGKGDNTILSDVDVIKSPGLQLGGSLVWDLADGKGCLTLTNTMPLTPPLNYDAIQGSEFTIKPNNCSVNLFFSDNGACEGTYRCILSNGVTDKKFPYHGALLYKNDHLGINGTTSRGNYLIKADLEPHPHLTRWKYTVGKRDLINLSADQFNPEILTGSMRWAFIRSFFNRQLSRFIFNNKCCFAVSIDQHDLENISGKLHLEQGRFFIPDYHNLIQNIDATFAFNIPQKTCTCNNVVVGMSKGKITCPQATILFSDDYGVSFVHAPCTVENMFVNWKQDFYGIVYGTLLINKLPDQNALLSGRLVLKKSLLKDTFFSNDQQSMRYGPLGSSFLAPLPIGLDLKIITEKPAHAKTPTIETMAMLDLTIKNATNKGPYSSPHLLGTINLHEGYLKFFRNKLRIESGKIQFLPQHDNDPFVDITAKNRIGKYLIALQVNGSLHKPTIQLESTPDLSEEQIISILLTGSENATLQADLPAMLLQNLDSFIFDSKKYHKNAAWINTLSKTLKYIQITPNLSDEPNQSMLKGSVSVNLNDQLRANIQKSLDLQKDFSAQLEYMLSDDINVKVVKDHRGELGSEVEMRLKLG